MLPADSRCYWVIVLSEPNKPTRSCWPWGTARSSLMCCAVRKSVSMPCEIIICAEMPFTFPISSLSLTVGTLLQKGLLWWCRSAFWEHSQKGCKVCILGFVFPLINYRPAESVTGWMCSNLSLLKADRVSGTFIQCLLKGAVTLQESLYVKEHTFLYSVYSGI